MQAFKILLLLSAFGGRAVASNETLSIDIVSSEVADFLQLLQNGSLSANAGDVFQRSLPSGCSLACSFLSFVAPGKVSYPGSAIFTSEEAYWSQQQASQSPTCRFSPTYASDVSLAVLAFQVTQCQFAVKSGGHAAFAGASNVDNGVTIDLLNLNQLSVSADKTETSVGPGNRWVDVYNYLEPKGLAVIGGRVSEIGTGGLTLGGGISFFSARYGWACDNVNNYQVVFADGTIRDVSRSTYPDLFFALRGGGNNFGIVTRFDLATFPQGNLWAGSETFFYDNATATAMNNALYNLNINSPSDPYAQVILAYAYYQPYDLYIIASDLQYGKPIANPPILSNFTSIPGAFSSTLRITNLTGLTSEFQVLNPNGNRQTYWTLMVRNSATLMADITNIFKEEVIAIKAVAGVGPSINFQPISTAMTSQFSKNGSNSLGISASDGPLNLINVVVSWSLPSDDAIVIQAARNMINRSNATAYAQGLGHPFLYQNYAAAEQQVFQSYGKANLLKLQAASRKYDPTGVWQKLQPGYFKVGTCE